MLWAAEVCWGTACVFVQFWEHPPAFPQKSISKVAGCDASLDASVCLWSWCLAVISSRNEVSWALQEPGAQVGQGGNEDAPPRGCWAATGGFQLSSKLLLPSRDELTSLPRGAAPAFLQDGPEGKFQLWATPVPALVMLHWWRADGMTPVLPVHLLCLAAVWFNHWVKSVYWFISIGFFIFWFQ